MNHTITQERLARLWQYLPKYLLEYAEKIGELVYGKDRIRHILEEKFILDSASYSQRAFNQLVAEELRKLMDRNYLLGNPMRLEILRKLNRFYPKIRRNL